MIPTGRCAADTENVQQEFTDSQPLQGATYRVWLTRDAATLLISAAVSAHAQTNDPITALVLADALDTLQAAIIHPSTDPAPPPIARLSNDVVDPRLTRSQILELSRCPRVPIGVRRTLSRVLHPSTAPTR